MKFTLVSMILAAGALAAPEKRDGPGIVKAADSQIGIDYVYGGGGCKGPSKGGYDCSGLTQYSVCKAQGKTIRACRHETKVEQTSD